MSAPDTMTLEKVVAPDVTITAKSPEQVASLVQQMELMATTRKDWIAQTQHIAFRAGSEPGDIKLVVDMGGVVGSVEYPSITKHAHRQISQAIRIPWDYYTRMLINDPRLLASNLNAWLEKDAKSDGVSGRMYEIRTMLGRVRAWLGDSYLNIDNDPLFFHAWETLKTVDAQLVRADLTETSFYMRALKADWGLRINRQQEIARGSNQATVFEGFDDRGGIHKTPVTAPIGDRTTKSTGTGTGGTGGTGDAGSGGVMYQASRDPNLILPGICIANSEVGMRSFTVECVLFTPYCSNTAIFGERIARVHRTSRHDVPGLMSDETKKLEAQLIWAEVGDLIRAVFDMDIFTKFVEKMSRASGMVLENPIEAVESVVKNYKITDADKQRILNELMSGIDGGTVLGLMNAITATGRDKSNYDDAHGLEKIGAQFIEDVVDNMKQNLVVVRR